MMDDEKLNDESQDKKIKKKKIRAIRVRAVKYRIYNPMKKIATEYIEGDEISPVWPEIVKLAEQDTGHRSLVIIYE